MRNRISPKRSLGDIRLGEDQVSVLEIEMLLDVFPPETQMAGLSVEMRYL